MKQQVLNLNEMGARVQVYTERSADLEARVSKLQEEHTANNRVNTDQDGLKAEAM